MKLVKFLSVALLAVGFAACNNAEAPKEEQAPVEATEVVAEPTEEVVVEATDSTEVAVEATEETTEEVK